MNFQHQLHKLRLETRHALGQAVRMAIGPCALVFFQNTGAALNDTGITQCADDIGYSASLCVPAVSGDGGSHPRQDAVVGRDAIAAPHKGFDFTKIDNQGNPTTAALGSGPNDWACTKDNVTNLVWEVKTSTAGLRDQAYTYSWFKSNATTSGASQGVVSAGTCFAGGRCDTEKYVADVIAAGLCGSRSSDPSNVQWRLPTFIELQSIVDFGSFNPTIDLGFFPNTPAGSYWWVSNPMVSSGGTSSWAVGFINGASFLMSNSSANKVRLVRGGQ